MLRILSEEEIKQANRDMLKWLEEALEGKYGKKYGAFIYSINLQIKHMVEHEAIEEKLRNKVKINPNKA